MSFLITKTDDKISQTNKYYNDLLVKISNKSATVAVIGMGYVGLPNMVYKAKSGYDVIGFDINAEKVEKVNKGINYIKDVNDIELYNLVVNKNKIKATTDFSLLSKVDVIMICVPTPIDEFKQPDLSYIKNATQEVVKNVSFGSLIILESTTYPSTTEDVIVKELEKNGFVIGENIFVAYSPERIDPSNKKYTLDNTPRIVGGHTDYCTEVAKRFIGGNVKTVSSTKVAEMAKVYENTFRFVNIALANELNIICNKMNIDTWEVIEASGTKPYGFMAFYPTVGVGGHCIPVDPYYLSWYAKKYKYNSQLIETASYINDVMNDYTVKKVMGILNEQNKSLKGSNLAILGATYKKDIDDIRESPIFRFYESLVSNGSKVTIYDDYVNTIDIGNINIEVKNIVYEDLSKYDLVILLVDHSYFDYDKIAKYSKCIFDTKNAFKHIEYISCDYYKM